MKLESNYGSSEYSPEAEELFARYLLDLEAGQSPDFEELCASHEEQADELYGLHADWDNVRGLLRQLESRKPASPATESPAQSAPEAQAPLPAARALAPGSAPQRSGMPWKLLTAAAAVLAAGLGLWSTQLLRDSEVLAQEKQDLTSEGQRVRAELASTRESREQLAARETELESALDTTERERDDVLGQNEQLAQSLEDERQAKLELDQRRERLARELEAEQLRQREAQAELQRTRALALSLRAEDLRRREAQLWPSIPALLPRLDEWSQQVQALIEEAAEPLALLADSPEPEDARRIDELQAALAPLDGIEGLLARTGTRRLRLEGWMKALEAEDAQAWKQTFARIADPSGSPLYGNIDWPAQCGLSPLGVDPQTGLLRFADLQSGEVPLVNAQGELVLEEKSALILVLVPGIELEDNIVPPFLVALDPWTEEHRARALGERTPGLGAAERELGANDLRRLGFEPLTSLRAELARQAGLRLVAWERHPVRPLVLAAPSGAAQASFGE